MNAAKPADRSLSRLVRWVLGYALRRWPALLVVLLTMLLKVGLNVLRPWPMVLLVDHVLQRRGLSPWAQQFVENLPGPHTQSALVGWAAGGTVLIFLLGWAAGLAEAYAGIRLGQRMVYDVAADLFARLQQLSLRFHASRSVGDNIRRVTADSACVTTILRDAFLPALAAVVSVILMCGILWRVNASLTLLALAVVPAMILVFRRYARPMLDLSFRQQDVESRIYETIEQTLTAIPIVQAYGREAANDQRFAAATDDTLQATLTLTRVQLRFKVLIGLCTAIGTAAILWFGGQLGLQNNFSVGDILLFLSYLSSLYSPIEAVVYTSSTLQGAAGSARRVLEVLETEREVADKPGASSLGRVLGEVRLDRVTFGYELDRPVLRGVSLAAQPGETIALVGPTGAGKSTLAALIPRFFDPWEGNVFVDGKNVRDVRLRELREQVAVVLQDPFLFPMTIAENIAYGRPHATLTDIEQAARAANAHEFIARLPQGYRAVVGERGATLSVGQRQRLSIARALLKNAPILILDEPTSALDVETEKALMDALGPLTANRTTFIIAHRLTTVRRASRIAFLEGGVIAETGTHEELLARAGRYAWFYRLQSSATSSADAEAAPSIGSSTGAR